MNKKMEVLVIGELNVDIILNGIREFPVIGKEVIAERMTVTMGSSSAIFACNLSTLGTNVGFLGKIGKDHFGRYIITVLNEKKVNTFNVIQTDEYDTGATIVMSFAEDRANVTYPGAMEHLTVEDITGDILSSCSHLHVSSVFLQTALKKDLTYIFEKAKQLGLTTSLDPQWDPAEKWDIDLPALLPFVDIFMPNNVEMMALTSSATAEEAMSVIKDYSNITVIKNGNSGACLWNGQELLPQKAYLNKNVADSIGAGDSFNAGFIHRYIREFSLEECLDFAALTGAVSTTRQGGTGAFENYEMVKQIAGSSFNYTL
jgi:sugar/nucleoside kinase (ribokinase family)